MWVRSDGWLRRQFLELLTVGVLGVITVVLYPFRQTRSSLGENNDSNSDTPDRNAAGGELTYDVYVFGGEDEYEALDSAGETIDSGSDGWAVLESGVDAVPEGGSIYVKGVYEGTSTIEIRTSIRMYGRDAYIDHQGGDFVFNFAGNERYQTTLASDAETGDISIELDDTSNIRKGDMILLEEEDGDPVLGREQPPGESHSVLEVDGNDVRLEDTIVWRGDYPSGTLVYVIDPIEVHVSGFSFEAPAKDENYYGVGAQECRNSTFENLWFDKFGSRALALEACANARVRDCTILQSADIEAADGYGVQVRAGCHDVIVEGCVAKECRHPLSVTPAGEREVASRTITFRDCFVTADGSAALNCHGGAAHDVRFEGCMVHTWGETGLRTGAQETNVSGCEFRMDDHNAITTRNDGQEMILTVTDTDIFGAGRAIDLRGEDGFEFTPRWKLVHIDGVRAYDCFRFFELQNEGVDRVEDLVIRGCYWDEVEEEGMRIRNRIDRGIIKGNDFGAAPNGPHIGVLDAPNTDVTNLQIVGNRFRKPDGTDTFIRLARSEQCVVSDNKFEAAADVNIYVDDAGSTANLVKQNTYYAPDATDNPIYVDDGSLAENNYVYDNDAEEWL